MAFLFIVMIMVCPCDIAICLRTIENEKNSFKFVETETMGLRNLKKTASHARRCVHHSSVDWPYSRCSCSALMCGIFTTLLWCGMISSVVHEL